MKPVYKQTIKKIIKSNRLTNNANPFLNKRVPDAGYNYFKIENSKFEWDSLGRMPTEAKACPVLPTVLVILESPHKDEFDCTTGAPKLPLMNDDKFRRFFDSKIASYIAPKCPNGSFQVVLMNAIQLQCSLGHPTNYYRDYVFLYFWEKLHSDFERRLQNFVNKHKVCLIANCCTKGGHSQCTYLWNRVKGRYVSLGKSCCKPFVEELGIKKSLTKKHGCALRDFVAESINVVNVTNIPVLQVSHPASWR